MANRRLFEVERVQMNVTVYALDARHASLVAQFIGIGRIHHEGRLPTGSIGELLSKLAAQLRRVLHAIRSAASVIEHDVVYRIGAALHGQETAAAPHKGIDIRKVDIVFFQCLQNGLAAIRQLRGDIGKLGELLRIMVDGLGKEAAVSLEHAHLRRRGTGVDHENTIALFHATHLPLLRRRG